MKHPRPRIRHRGLPPIRRRLWSGGEPPRLRRELLARDVFRIAFFLPHDHSEIAKGVSHAVEAYLRGVGQGLKTLRHSFTNDDEGDELTEERWNYVHYLLSPDRPFRFIDELPDDVSHRMEKRGYATQVILNGGARSRNGYELRYKARIPRRDSPSDVVSLLSATVPTEYLVEHGPARVRELALEMASRLRFSSGHAGLAIRFYWPLRRSDDAFRAELSRYPGIDSRPVPPWPWESRGGTHINGIHWLNFIGQPLLDQMGGAELLRSRIQSPGSRVQGLDGHRLLISLGAEPEAGDRNMGHELPAYGELARVLGPWLSPETGPE